MTMETKEKLRQQSVKNL